MGVIGPGYLGDYFSGCTVTGFFNTLDCNPQAILTVGAGSTIAGLVAYKDAFLACSTAGSTLVANCNGISGINSFSINTNASPTFFSCGHDYHLILIGGTATIGTTVLCTSGQYVASFSLDNRSALRPTVHATTFDLPLATQSQIACTIWNQLRSQYGTCGTFGFFLDCEVSSRLGPTVKGRTLDVTANGAAGLDWGNIENSNASNFLSCTSQLSVQSICNSVSATATVDFTAQQNIACTVWNQLASAYDTCGSFGVLIDASITSRLAPTTAGRTLDVSTGGEAGLDWANIGSPQTVQRLGCTSLFQVQQVCNDVSTVASVAFTEQGIACTVWNSLQSNYDVCGSFGVLLDSKVSAAGGGTMTEGSISCTVWNQLRSQYGTCGTFGYLLDCNVASGLQPTTPGRRLDVSTGGTAGLDWANIDGAATAQRFGCTSIFDVTSVCNTVVVSSGSITTVTGNVGGSVGSVTAGVTVTTNSDKTGYRLSSAGTSDIFDCILTEPSGVFAWAGATLRTITAWMGAVTSNQIQQSATQQGICDRAATTRIAKSEVSCSAGVVTRGSFV